jgi:hypothetical protein
MAIKSAVPQPRHEHDHDNHDLAVLLNVATDTIPARARNTTTSGI